MNSGFGARILELSLFKAAVSYLGGEGSGLGVDRGGGSECGLPSILPGLESWLYPLPGM